MRFIVTNCDYSGLGFATRLQDEGHEVLLATNPPEADRTPERLRPITASVKDCYAKCRCQASSRTGASIEMRTGFGTTTTPSKRTKRFALKVSRSSAAGSMRTPWNTI